jgi:hypothetical protein
VSSKIALPKGTQMYEKICLRMNEQSTDGDKLSKPWISSFLSAKILIITRTEHMAFPTTVDLDT